MKRRLISYICLITLFMESVPVNALSNITSEVITQKSTEDSEQTKESNEQKDNTEDKDVNSQATDNKTKLEDNVFNMYILDKKEKTNESEIGFSIGFNEKESKFKVSNQSEKQLSKENLNTVVYKINIYDKNNKEKLNIELLGSDTGKSEKLNALKELKYEVGDTIKITSIDPKNGLKILGEIQGDINKDKEDYSDGVDNLDYIDNVRFEIGKTNLKTVYNQAPVFEGLTDLLDVENPDIDVLEGVKVTDDHDGIIDNSKIVIQVHDKTKTSAILTYTVEDSWGRTTSATRNVAAKAKIDMATVTEDDDSSENNQTEGIASNIITVEGVPYNGNLTQRFKIKFDTASKSINITDEDGRVLSNTERGDYFKFVLYDKNMEVKASVTLKGSDKSDSEKLDAINNHLYEEGDYIGIWHEESDTKLKIGGTVKATTIQNGEANPNGTNLDYTNGLPKREISERRFRIKNTGLEEVDNQAPVIQELPPLTVERGKEVDLLEGVSNKITDDFDAFNTDNLENGYVSITNSKFDNTRVGEQTITYTATDRWGRSSTKDRTVTVTSTNPLDSTDIEFMNPNNNSESLFKIGIDPVKKQLFVEDIDNLPDTTIDSSKSSSIFKLKVYTQGGVLQKTLNIRGTDKLKTVLKRINGYEYGENDRIELWSTTPKNIRVIGQLIEDDNENTQGYKDYVPNENNSNYKEDYTNGINNPDYMKNVRFEIGKTNLKYIYNEAPKFTINTKLTAQRNGEVDYMNGISVSDDHDENLLEKVTHSDINTSTIGDKYVEYKVVDSWGRSTLVERKVTVYPDNNLEYNYITIKNNETNEPILSIRFDEDTKKFKVNKLDASKIPSSLDDNDKLLEIKLIKKVTNPILKLFKSSESEKIINITKDDLINNNLDDKFNSVEYNYGDYLSFDSYDYANGLFISAKSDILLNGFDNEDQMANTRFEIKQEGLQIIYNNAPQINGLENTLYLYKGEDLTLDKAIKNISVEDDLDGTIASNAIEVKYDNKTNGQLEDIGQVDTNTIGNIELNYKVTDSWGRSTSKIRKVSIISKSVSNDIEFYNEGGNTELFSLKYNPISHEFDVTINEEVSSRTGENTNDNVDSSQPGIEQNPDSTPNTGTESQPQPDTEPENEVVFRLNIFNTTGEEVGKLELSEDELSNPISFSALSNIGIYDDYYFSVWSNESSRIKIKGDIDGENNLGESGHESEDYSEGIQNDDYMNNVRFKLRTDGLEAVYNKAPKIIIKSRNILTAYAGDPIDYTSDVVVEDDHDGNISSEDIKVNVVEDNTEDELEIGYNTVNLSVEDSWGRESNIDRKLLIINGIDKNTISFTDNNSKVLDIGFNHINRKLIVNEYNHQFGPGNDISNYVRIQIKRGEQTLLNIRFTGDEKPVNCADRVNQLKNFTFEYGDIILLTHQHPYKIKIDGTVDGAREDYTDGIQNVENIINTKFEITKSGLKAIYTDPDSENVTNNNVVFGPMAPEKFPFKIKIDIANRSFNVLEPNGNTVLYSYNNQMVYKIVLIGSNGTIKREISFTGRSKGDDNRIREWCNQGFEYGDALYIWHTLPDRSILKGNIINQREDYSNGVDNVDNMNNVVFKLTQDGVECVYNNAPVINGADDINVYQNTEFNLLDGITITDDFDTDHLRQITVTSQGQTTTVTTSGNGETLNPNSILLDTSHLGEQNITYTATDRWGNTTTVERKITVRPNLYKNVFKVFSDTDQETPIFEIGFDSVNNKYRVFNQKSEKISSENLSETAFEINIISSDGTLKKKITLTGNDRGNSPNLEELNKVTYEEGDIIRIYRNDIDSISISGDVTGDVPESSQILNETDKFNYMMNTGFKVSNDGLEAIYNEAPTLNGVISNKIVSKGTVINLLDGLSVSDDIDENISPEDIDIYINGDLLNDTKEYTFNSLGTYDIEYVLYDSWGRGILKEVTITVESKVRDNKIEVYDANNNLSFKVTFDTTNDKFILTSDTNSTTFTDLSTEDTTNEVVDDSNENGYFKIIVRDIKGDLKYSVVLNGNQAHDLEELKQIHNKPFSRYDTISLSCNNPSGVKIQGSVINSDNNATKDYSNGFENIDNYQRVRFKITDDGLKEVINKKIKVLGLDKKTIKRGEKIDFLEGVVVDVQDTNNEDYKIQVNSEGFNNLKEGDYEIEYTFTNSWGQVINKTRTITVEPRTELEKIKLNVKNNRNEVILTIGFDSIERKLRVINYIENATIDSNNGNLAFAINAYDSLGNTLGTMELKGTDAIDNSIVTRLNNFAYIEGYRLSIWAKNPQIHLSLDGDIKVSNKNTIKAINNDTITPVDKMENGRFEILNNGLEYIYNEAPIISGGDNAIDYYKGTLLTLPEDISVTDDHDKISGNQVTIDDDQVDYDRLGEQDITYIVEDSWGRVGKKAGKINVISSIDKNEINISCMNSQGTAPQYQIASISFKRENGINRIKVGGQTSDIFYPNAPEGTTTFMTIKLYGENGSLKKEFKLLPTESSNNSVGLRELNNYEFDSGDYISIDGITEATKGCIKIIGTVVNEKESYIDGINKLDNIQNVRFKLTDLGLESVYNQAPTITIDKSINLDAVKGDNIPYMRGVRLNDDYDKLTSANVEVTWNPNEIPQGDYEPYNDVIKGVAKVGENTLHYKVTDTWGRSAEADRTINLSNGILENSILLKSLSMKDMARFTFVKEENDAQNEVTLKLNVINRTDTIAPGGYSNYYTIKIVKPNGDSYTRLWYSEDHYTNQFDFFNNMKLPYGTTIEFINTGHPDRLSIDGPVRNQREDYSDGVQNPDNLRSIKFEVTDCGLKSVYVEKDQIEGNQNIISLMSKESIPLQFKIDPATKKINVYSSNYVTLYWQLRTGPNDTVLPPIEVFRMTLKGPDGIVKAEVSGDARDKGDNPKFSDAFNDRSFEYGDTLTIWHYTPSRVAIKGKEIKGAREDYSNGVDNSKNLTEAVFKLTSDGLEVIYKDPPKIMGIKDTKILKGQPFTEEILDDLTSDLHAKDNIDGDYNNKLVVSQTRTSSEVPYGTLVIDPTSINTNQVGMYEVRYSVTNSNNRTTTKSSTVVVYDKPTIEKSENCRIELNSIENNEEAIVNRLKEAVTVSDDDDKLYGKETKLEILEQHLNPNEAGSYDVKYKATDLNGASTIKTIPIEVSRTISVTVPTTIPFQVVTNLKDKDADSFISGVMKVQNNNTSDVDVYLDSFTRQDSPTTKNRSYKQLEIVPPNTFTDWNTISQEDSMTKMALGIYNKNGLIVDSNLQLTEQDPLWLTENMHSVKLGVLNRAQNLKTPYESKLSFTSKHGKEFIGGSSKGKFNLVFRFE